MKHKNTFHHFQLRSFFKFQFLPRPISVTLTPLIKRCVFLLLHCMIRLHTQKNIFAYTNTKHSKTVWTHTQAQVHHVLPH